jgi:phage shock protein PspC (stress-responsive transcriptional regulator)
MNGNPQRLYRSSEDRIIAGVAGGVAAYFDVDPIIVRILWVLSVPVTGTLSFWAYVIMIFVVPPEPSEWPASSPWAPGGAPTGFSAEYTAPAGSTAVPPAEGGTSTASAATTGAAPAATGPLPDTAPGGPAYGSPQAAGFAAVPGGQQSYQNPSWNGDWRSQRRQERWQRRAARLEARRENGRGGLVFGLLLILVGGMLAWHQIDPNFDVNLTWPVVIVVVGLILVVTSIRRNERD